MRDTGVRRLLRSLSLTDFSVLSSSSMAPAYSIAAVMGLVVAAAGVGAPLALIVSTIPIIFIAIGFSRLSTDMPSAGGAYSWSRLAFGNRTGWFTAMVVIIAYYFGTIATALPAGVYTVYTASLIVHGLTPSPLAIAIVATLWIAFSTYFLVIGARPTARLSAVFLSFEIIALLIIAVLAFFHPFEGTRPQGALPTGIALGNAGINGLIIGAVFSIWISAGWEISTYSSEEARGPAGNPGAGALIGLIGTVTLVWICMVAFLRVGTVPGFTEHQQDALAYIAERLGGGWVAVLMTAAVLVSSAASLWTTMLSLSRAVFAMGRDGLLPEVFAAVHPKYGSPWAAILAVGLPCMAVMLVSGILTSARNTLSTVVGASSIFLGATFIVTGLACAYLYGKRAERTHLLSGIVLPAVGALGTLGFLVYNVTKQQEPLLQGIIAGGLILALIFAAVAGRWVARRPLTIAEEEA
ncbi:MAG: hypothetical protein DLM53_11975 [Candidatus Eremiobacter antarcticus]|nr:amino acid permease [Candidatus Eremiobacteraeota bacterium]MBC5808946.1 amino acid permease [Candidatus Eremiobacteraeota bacterium]PZR60374.1 MAG: hypothetical protein DLM53_11975 [Candidatus Eremiobacter sp. RRmetagenome_bin22]